MSEQIDVPARICANCRYYVLAEVSNGVREFGQCYLHPPVRTDDDRKWGRPNVMWSDFCKAFALSPFLDAPMRGGE